MDKKQNVFIIGYPRSGTSLLRVILDSHLDISIGPEIKFLQKIIRKYPMTFADFLEVSKREKTDYQFSIDDCKNIYNKSTNWNSLLENWCNLYSSKRGKKIWGDKTPQSYKYLLPLIKAFPDAMYIYIVRNPFDVMGSMISKGWYKRPKSILAWCYSNFISTRLKTKNNLFIRYEDFADNPQKHVEIILNKINLEKIDLVSSYQDVDHGRIAVGDTWNKPIESSDKKKKIALLKKTDKILIGILCFYFIKKYNY